MKAEEKILKLAEKVQLEIKKEDVPFYLETLFWCEKLLVNFQKIKLPKKSKTLTRINTGYLTMRDLEKLTKKFSSQKPVQPSIICKFHFNFTKLNG